jgi:hypothetical protein
VIAGATTTGVGSTTTTGAGRTRPLRKIAQSNEFHPAKAGVQIHASAIENSAMVRFMVLPFGGHERLERRRANLFAKITDWCKPALSPDVVTGLM